MTWSVIVLFLKKKAAKWAVKKAVKYSAAVVSAVKWLTKALKGDRFATIWGFTWPCVAILFALLWWFKPGPQEILVPHVTTVNGKPVTHTVERPVTIYVMSGWQTIVDPGGKLRVDKFGFRFIPKGGVAWTGEVEPYGGACWFVCDRFGIQTMASRDRFFPIGLDACLPGIKNITADLNLGTRWGSWDPGLYGGLSVRTR